MNAGSPCLATTALIELPCLDRDLILYTHHPGAYTNGYHAHSWRDGARIETFYHLVWWMLRSPSHAEVETLRRTVRAKPRENKRLRRLLAESHVEVSETGSPAIVRNVVTG
jgi:hypothetical protein